MQVVQVLRVLKLWRDSSGVGLMSVVRIKIRLCCSRDRLMILHVHMIYIITNIELNLQQRFTLNDLRDDSCASMMRNRKGYGLAAKHGVAITPY